MDFVERGHRVTLSTLVLYEWLRGPRSYAELSAQEDLFPRNSAVPFDVATAVEASKLYATLPRARARAVDLAIAASALIHGASLWTLNADDFDDIPGLRLM